MVSGRKWDSDASYLPVEDTDSVWKPDLDIENARDFHDTEIVDKGMSPAEHRWHGHESIQQGSGPNERETQEK